MKHFQSELILQSPNRGTYNITEKINKLVIKSGIQSGICNVFIQHTSASLIITENADPTVRQDIEYWLHDYRYKSDDSNNTRQTQFWNMARLVFI